VSFSRSLLGLLFLAALPASSATVLILRFHNASEFPDLSWVGESVSEVLSSELSATNLIVINRDTRSEAMKRLSLRAEADFTKATVIRVGQTVDADYVIYGSYNASPDPAAPKELRNSQLNVTARLMDLRHFHDGPEVTETGKLADLARLEEHLAWQNIKFLDPASNPKIEDFLAPQKIIRVDAQESYVRGLLSTNRDQRQKWFMQAVNVDSRFISPSMELGKLLWEKKDYRAALQAFQHVPAADTRYPEARFRMGLCAYNASDFSAAAAYFSEVAKKVPLNEVYNNLAASEAALNQPAALDDFRKAFEGDPNDPVYAFNLGLALLRQNQYAEAVKHLTAAAESNTSDDDAETLLTLAEDKTPFPPGTKSPVPVRLKMNFDATAFRELKAMLTK
jgi:Flp pilus assembly protein TadD/TolB-like protein